jgi:amidophosphoribosyltransferase
MQQPRRSPAVLCKFTVWNNACPHGNLTNAEFLAKEIFEADLRNLETHSDSEVLLNVFAHEVAQEKNPDPTPDDIFAAISRTHKRVKGAYAVVGIIANVGLFAFRDPHGIRPLCFGSRKVQGGKIEYAIASESVAFSPLGFQLERDIAPGEAVFIDWKGNIHTKQCSVNTSLNPCILKSSTWRVQIRSSIISQCINPDCEWESISPKK